MSRVAVPIRGILTLLLALASGLLIPGCRGDGPPGDPGISVEVSVSPTPAIQGPTRVLVAIEGAGGEPLAADSVRLFGTMDHAGMEPAVARLDRTGEGRWAAPGFPLGMAGEWILEATAWFPDGRVGKGRTRISVAPNTPPGGGDGGR